MASRRVFVVGVGMTKFEKPGLNDNIDYPELAEEAVAGALRDAGIPYHEVQQATAGFVYGDSTSGQRALYGVGLTGIPIYNVNNNCSTGSTALFLAKQLVEGGIADCVLALGFEKMEKGSLTSKFTDRTNPMDRHVEVLANVAGLEAAPITAQMFGSAGAEHMKKYGTKAEHFAKIAWKNHKHSTNNPKSQFQKEYSLEEILNSPQVYGPLTKLQCCPTSDGAAAAVVVSEDFVKRHNLQGKAVEILDMEMATDLPSTFQEESCIKMVGYDMTKKAADQLFQKTGLSPEDVQVVELHDCFATNELLTYEALGLCEPGKGGWLVDSGNNTYGGKYVVNPSGGLISKGHPLGATGIAQCAELCWQLRGEAGPRQVPNCKVALQHNIGLGGAAVVGLYRLGFPEAQRGRVGTYATSAQSDEFPDPNIFQVNIVFNEVKERMVTEGSDHIPKIKTIFAFKIKSPEGKEGYYIVDAKNGNGAVFYGKEAKEAAANGLKPEITFTMADQDAVDLIVGRLDPQKAYFSGRLKIHGNLGRALKLKELTNQYKKELRSKI